jgi:hypothetical protein
MHSRILTLIATSLLATSTFAQFANEPIGVGATPFALASDYRSLGWNPSALTASGLNPNLVGAAASIEGGFGLQSTVLGREDLWGDVFNRTGYEDAWRGLTRDQWLERLVDEDINAQGNFTVAGTFRKGKRWGFAYRSRQHFLSEVRFDANTAEVLLGGAPSDLFTSVLVNDSLFSLSDISLDTLDFLNQVVSLIPGDAIVGDLLGETRLGFQYLRSHELGISKQWGSEGDWQLHTGVTGRLLLGNGYFEVRTDESGELDAFGAFSSGFQVPQLDSVSLSPTFDGLRQWGPVGQGWSVDVGATIRHPEGHWVAAAVTNIGVMEWRGERYSVDDALQNWAASATGPSQVVELMTTSLNPSTWFDSGIAEVRRVNMPGRIHLGGGYKATENVLLAADASFDNRDRLGGVGSRMGASMVLQLLANWRVDLGVSHIAERGVRFPVGSVFRFENSGFEMGIRAGDIQALWNSVQSDVSTQFCFARWTW